MQATNKPRVKVCCISSPDEARLAIRYGAAALGLVSSMPSGPGVIADSLIGTISHQIPPPIARFLLTSEVTAEPIIAQQHATHVNTIQFVDRLNSPNNYMKIRSALPGISLVQVVHVNGPEALEEAVAIAPYVDAILTDSGNQALAIKELGGTGRRHDWQISREIRAALEIPLFLAGGLKPENVREAIAQVGSFGLDICSGLRTDGKLDEQKVAAFFQQVELASAPE